MSTANITLTVRTNQRSVLCTPNIMESVRTIGRQLLGSGSRALFGVWVVCRTEDTFTSTDWWEATGESGMTTLAKRFIDAGMLTAAPASPYGNMICYTRTLSPWWSLFAALAEAVGLAPSAQQTMRFRPDPPPLEEIRATLVDIAQQTSPAGG